MATIEALKTLGGLIKLRGKVKEIAKNSEFQQLFLGEDRNNVIINVKGDLYLGDLSKITPATKKKLLSGLKTPEKETKKDISFFKYGFYPRVLEYSGTKITDKKLEEYLKYAKSSTRNLFEMSLYAKALFDKGRDTEANRIRSDIGNHYGKTGRKFCNLYLQGYIDNFIEYLNAAHGDKTEEIKKNFESEIMDFVEHSENIFFIHPNSDPKLITMQILAAINRNEIYIALHAGGSNIKKANEIFSSIKKDAISKEYDIKEENLESKSKCLLFNVYITKTL